MIQSDVCIIGAGPAGAATSLTLAKMSGYIAAHFIQPAVKKIHLT